MESLSVKIGPKFFRNELREYADWRWAYVREALQNCLDAPGTRTVRITIEKEDGNTKFVFENDGKPMTKDILVNKLMTMGETGKNFEGSVGGFGKAKVLLYLAQERFTIRTGDLVISGSGGEYDLLEGQPEVAGTRSEVIIPGDQTNYLQESVRKFASYAQWDGVIVLNGERLECKLKKGSPRRDFEWGTVYTNKSIPHRVIVRVNGIPMFSHRTELDRTVIIELKGASVDVLTSNRDGLVYRYEDEFDTFLSDLITNKSKALKAQNPTYTHFSGAKFKANPERKASTANARSIVGDTAPVLAALAGAPAGAPAVTTGGESVLVSTERIGVMEGTAGPVAMGPVAMGPVSVISEEFVLKNETTLKIPDYYQPDSDQFGSYSKKLARMWGRLLLELHRMYSLEQEFAIGFVFSDDAEAQYEKTWKYGVVYYLNPAIIVEQQNSASKSFKKRFQLSERDRLLAIAVHEFVHGLGFSSHSEDFACKLTEVTGRVLTHARKGGFSWCYR